MTDAFIVRRGGAGGMSKSMILVTAPKGTTSVTATYNSKTVKGRFKDGYWRLTGLDYGPSVAWMVSISNGAETSTKEQPMENLSIKYLEMSYWHGELYDAGNEYESATGGWMGEPFWSGIGAGTYENVDGQIKLKAGASNVKQSIQARTINKIDLTDFNTLKVNVVSRRSGSLADKRAYLSVVDIGGYNESDVAILNLQQKPNGTYELDVSGLTGEYYIALRLRNFGDPQYYLYVDKLWLE